ncbi:unnamed protein product [Microthlaspi erraticum]|uniref:Uncharacterized protein n=1 Tax=Microthlaspi erraticum TaxID=1685480 RepID=A0A6D2HBJ8_9BRAS|nr:unnamed protein product [Microthlaspi erraticum]
MGGRVLYRLDLWLTKGLSKELVRDRLSQFGMILGFQHLARGRYTVKSGYTIAQEAMDADNMIQFGPDWEHVKESWYTDRSTMYALWYGGGND